MEQTPTPSPGHAAARRRLLVRGAMAAPALMTVCSGASAATASNLRCLTNANTIPQTGLLPGTTAQDSYMRVQLYKVTVVDSLTTGTSGSGNRTGAPKKNSGSDSSTTNTTTDQFFIKGDDLQLLTTRGAGIPTSGQAIRINPATYVTIGSPGPLPTAAASTTPGYVNQWAAVRFDSSGAVVGLGADNVGAMVGASCWASVASYIP